MIDEKKPLVILFRGLPGSGKTTASTRPRSKPCGGDGKNGQEKRYEQ